MQYAYLKGEYPKAYEILSDLDSTIPLLNTSGSYEMDIFIELCLRYGNYAKAYKYIYELIANYGYNESFFDDYENIEKLRKQKFYNSKELAKLEKSFQADTVLVNELRVMFEADQYFRTLPIPEDAFPEMQYDPNWTHPYAKQFDSIDSINFVRLMEIIKTKGFPYSQNIKLTLQQRGRVFMYLNTMLVHFVNAFQFESMKQILLENIKTGNCPPQFLANMVDSRCRGEQCFIYGTYINLSREQICDFEKLDERRAAIGMPPHKLVCEINILLSQKYNSAEPRPEEIQQLLEQGCGF